MDELIFLVEEADEGELLRPLGCRVTRQSGSHLRLTTDEGGQHHVTMPRHDPLRVGTLSEILGDVARHFGTSREALLERLFGRGL
jgi:predicted RNA binding protein YcfA (HicA-like mRNA interferase family)